MNLGGTTAGRAEGDGGIGFRRDSLGGLSVGGTIGGLGSAEGAGLCLDRNKESRPLRISSNFLISF